YVMKKNKVVPVGNPYMTVWPYTSLHRSKPLIRAGHQIPPVQLLKAGAIGLDDPVVNQTDRRFTDEGSAIPVFLRIGPGRVQIMPRSGCKPTGHIPLPRVRCQGMRFVMHFDFLNGQYALNTGRNETLYILLGH